MVFLFDWGVKSFKTVQEMNNNHPKAARNVKEYTNNLMQRATCIQKTLCIVFQQVFFRVFFNSFFTIFMVFCTFFYSF